MATTRKAEAVWNGDLASGSGVVSAVSSGVFTDLPVTWVSRAEAVRRQDKPRGVGRLGPRRLLLHGAVRRADRCGHTSHQAGSERDGDI